MTAAEFKVMGQKLFDERRYLEAIPFLKSAVESSPEDEFLWRQLVHANRQCGQHEHAVIVAKQGIQHHERSAWLWMQLGSEFTALERLEEAETALDQSHRLNPRVPWLWRYYADLHRKRKEYSAEINALETIVELNEASGNDLNLLGNAHRNNGNNAKAVECYRRSFAKSPKVEPLFNMGLVFADPELSQDADAADVHRRALKLNPNYDGSKKQLHGIKLKLVPLAERARKASAGLVPLDKRFAFYVSPIETLNLTHMADVEELEPRVIQRANRKLLAAIELEETVSWLDDHRLDKSRAIAVVDELDDPKQRSYHFAIFQNKPLLRFLTRGEIDHFLYSDDYFPSNTLELLDSDPGFREFLSEPFAQQYNLLLSRAIDRSEMDVVEVLFDGRRWCSPEHDDICFAHAFERTTKLVEELASKAEETTKRKVGGDEISNWLAKNRVVELFNLLPIAFRTTQTAIVSKIRELALTCHNEYGDSKASRAILLLCKEFRFKSAELNERLGKDYAKIEEILAEEKTIVVARATIIERQRNAAKQDNKDRALGLLVMLVLTACLVGIGRVWDSIGSSSSTSTKVASQYPVATNLPIRSREWSDVSEPKIVPKPVFPVLPSPSVTWDDAGKSVIDEPLVKSNSVVEFAPSEDTDFTPSVDKGRKSKSLPMDSTLDFELPMLPAVPPTLPPVQLRADSEVSPYVTTEPNRKRIENHVGIVKVSATANRDIKPKPPPESVGKRSNVAEKRSAPIENQPQPKGTSRWKLPRLFQKRKAS